MWEIDRVVKKGDYLYAVVPNHPNATKNGYVLEHRVVMENSIKRLLTRKEVVHHIDHNKHNNKIENLELLGVTEHLKLHGKEVLQNIVELQCPVCESIFIRPRRLTHIIKKSVLGCTTCSPSCRGKLSSMVQYGNLTENIQHRMHNNIISEYRGKI